MNWQTVTVQSKHFKVLKHSCYISLKILELISTRLGLFCINFVTLFVHFSFRLKKKSRTYPKLKRLFAFYDHHSTLPSVHSISIAFIIEWKWKMQSWQYFLLTLSYAKQLRTRSEFRFQTKKSTFRLKWH